MNGIVIPTNSTMVIKLENTHQDPISNFFVFMDMTYMFGLIVSSSPRRKLGHKVKRWMLSVMKYIGSPKDNPPLTAFTLVLK